jgi:phosphoribosyl 1,2-cyclic phosphodiesterase
MRVTPLASGSQGNATLVEPSGPRGPALLIDAGLPLEELERRLLAVGRTPQSIAALLVTHRHRDHKLGVRDFALRHKTEIWCTRRTARALGTEVTRRLRFLAIDGLQVIQGCTVLSFALSHDAPQTVGFVIAHDGRRYAHLTDLGSWDGGLLRVLQGCDALLLEFNHDVERLRAGDDPPQLKARILDAEGHLSNDDAADLLEQVGHPGLERVWLAHLSARNNTPELARAAAARALSAFPGVSVEIALQHQPSSPWQAALADTEESA